MDFSENIRASEQADLQYAKWYAQLSDEQKSQFFLSAFNMVTAQIRKDAITNNAFCTEADVIMRFVELTQAEEYDEKTMAFIQAKLKERSEKEWQERFLAMKKHLNWSYNDIARFIGARSGASVKASVNRKLPAFAKLAVCVFEKMK